MKPEEFSTLRAGDGFEIVPSLKGGAPKIRVYHWSPQLQAVMNGLPIDRVSIGWPGTNRTVDLGFVPRIADTV